MRFAPRVLMCVACALAHRPKSEISLLQNQSLTSKKVSGTFLRNTHVGDDLPCRGAKHAVPTGMVAMVMCVE